MKHARTLARWRYGFDEPALGSQQTFRAILAAMQHPGQLITIHQNPDAPDIFNWASAATCLTLLDNETPVWTDINLKSPAINWLLFGCRSSVVTELGMANFVLVTQPANMPALDFFRIGRYRYLEIATTLVIQVDDILPGKKSNYSGIIADKTFQLELKGVPDRFWYQWQQLSAMIVNILLRNPRIQ